MIPDINKTVIVTGASQGIGAGLVKAFLDRRYNVVATSRSITKTGGFKASDKLELVDGSITSILQRPRELPPPALIQRDGQFIHPIAGEAPRLDQVIENRMSSETKVVSGYCQKGIK